MIQIGRLIGETVWDVITRLKEPLLTTAKILSSMSVTQVSVKRLFYSIKFILNDSRSLMTQESLEAILFLSAYPQQ